ncbi:MAG: Response regulator [Polaromonas sp.]|nr:Response regulator [Polaromonas sp.]
MLRDLLSLLSLTGLWAGKDGATILEIMVSAVSSVAPIAATVAHVALPPGKQASHYLKIANNPFEVPPQGDWHDFVEDCTTRAYQAGHVHRINSPQGPLRVLCLKMQAGGQGFRMWFCSEAPSFPSANHVIFLRAAVSLAAAGLHTASIDYERVQAGRAKDEFLAMLGHELRNPLAPMVTALDLISLKGSGHLAKEHAIIGRQADHLLRLVDDLLDITRVTRDVVVLNLQNVNIRTALVEAVENAGALIEEKHHRVMLELGPEGLQALGDPDRLRQIFVNLLINACKYTDAGGTITVSAGYEADAENMLFVSVQDNGTGIDDALLPKIFDLFEQGLRDSNRAQGGLGIGLAIVRKLVNLHGGSVVVQSEGKGKGALFTVRLPVAMQPAGTFPCPAPVVLPVLAPIRRRVLLVDDSLDILDTMSDFLRVHDFEVLGIAHPMEAIEKAPAFNADIYVLDIGLPDMDGYQLVKRLRQLDTNNAQFIALTGYGRQSDKQRAMAAGFDAHFAKPVDTKVLLQSMHGSAALPGKR